MGGAGLALYKLAATLAGHHSSRSTSQQHSSSLSTRPAAGMALLKCILLLVVALFALVAANPIPEPGGFGGGKHEHYIIHVPYHVHTVHHHHVKKVHVPVYIKEEHHGWHPWD